MQHAVPTGVTPAMESRAAIRSPLALAPPVAAAPGPAAGRSRQAGPARWPTMLLPLLAILLPLLLLGAIMAQAWQAAWREAESELAGTADAAAEYVLRVLTTQTIALGRMNEILRGFSDAEIRAEEGRLHGALHAMVAEIPKAAAAFVLDRNGVPLVAASTYPVPREPMAPDHEFLRALQDPAAPPVHLSLPLTSRITGERFLAVSRRRGGTGNLDAAGGPGAFDGVATIAVYPAALGTDLRRFRRAPGDHLALIRTDGMVLLGTTAPERDHPRLAAESPFHRIVAADLAEARYLSADPVAGRPRLVAVRAVAGFPVHVAAARPCAVILEEWRGKILAPLAVGLPATLALLALALQVRRAQRRLEEANAQLETRVAERTAALADLSEALDLTPTMVLDLEGRIRHWSAGCERLYGYSRAEATGQLARVLLRTEWPSIGYEGMMARLLRDGEWQSEVRQRRRDGSLVIAASHWILRRDPATGAPIGIVTTRTDLTPLRRAEDALCASERRLREAQEASGVIPFEVTAGGAIHASDRQRALYGLGLDETLDPATFFARIHPEDRAAVAADHARLARDGGVFNTEFRLLLPDGTLRWVQARGEAEADPDGGPMPRAMLGVNLDITERKLAEAAMAESEERLRLAQEAAGLGLFDIDLVTGRITWDARLRAICAVPEGMEITNRLFLSALHPEDRAARRAAVMRAMEPGSDGAYRVEYRLIGIADGIERWVSVTGRVRRDPATGAPVRMLGIVLDITARKQAELRNELLMREVDHRAKNALAVVQAALRLSRAETPRELVRMVEGRVAALARAQTVLAKRQWEGAELRLLLEGELAAFLADGEAQEGDAGPPPRARLSGPEVTIGTYAAQPISMALHELATNATKYGALSRAGGRVEVTWRLAEEGRRLVLEWRESGGPPIARPPQRQGFGSRVIEQTVTGQLGGRISREWRAEGLVCVLEVPLQRDAPAAPAQED